MNILWLKDKKIGHEKQVKAFLDELSKSREINIIESEVDYTFDDKLNEIFFGWFHKLTKTSLHTLEDDHIWNIRKKYKSSNLDIIIGAGSKTNIPMLRHKLHKKTKVISVMKPQFFQRRFDLIVAPRHDFQAIPENVHTYMLNCKSKNKR